MNSRKEVRESKETRKETKAYPPYMIVMDFSDMRDDFEDGDIPEELEDLLGGYDE